MKKIVVLVLCCCLLFSLTGCSVNVLHDIVDSFKIHSFYYEYDVLANNVDEAEIVDLNGSYLRVGTDNVEILKSLDYDTTLNLLYDLSQIEYKDTPIGPGQPPTPYDVCIRVWYLDGTFEIYDWSGTTVAWGECPQEDFENMLSKYMDG